ncbi:MAG: carboxypeptidase regulatory-like domain-containing protein [Candidatus Kryptoniota bacterium]
MLKRISTLSVVSIVGLLMLYSTSHAQMMMGFELNAKLSDGGKIELSWGEPSQFNVSYYVIYRAQISMAVNDTSLPTLKILDTTRANEYEDTSATLVPGNLVFYQVVAFDTTGGRHVHLSSTIARVYFNPVWFGHDRVRIVSQPPHSAQVGVQYTYQVVAVSSDSTAKIYYSLDDHPGNMKIDSTGLITWTPTSRGWREVEVKAISNKGGKAKQEFWVRVGAGDGVVKGIVTDTNGVPIPHVMVKLYQRDVDDHFDYKAVSDSAGSYTILHVDSGSYYIRAIPLRPDYLPQWYDGATHLKDAKAVVVSSTDTVAVNFKLQNRFHLLPQFTVTGVVTDTSKAPLQGASVIFVRAEFSYNSERDENQESINGEDYREMFQEQHQMSAMSMQSGMQDFRIDGNNSAFVFKTTTDVNGNYSLKIPQGIYIAFVLDKGYFRVFYNQKDNFLSADVIKLDSNITGINFVLTPIPPVVLGQISGSVVDSVTSSGVQARLVAFREKTASDTLKFQVANVYFSDTDSSGAYVLKDLPPGSYRVLAIPLGSYIPSFYSTAGFTTKWQNASLININGNSIAGANIYVMPSNSSYAGYTYITGSVTSTSSSAFGIMKSAATVGVSGGLVYATDANGTIVGYGITGTDGSYTINGIAPGSYTVSADIVGYTSTSSSASPTYDASGNPQPSTAYITANPVPTAVNEKPIQPTSYSLEQNYPNPFNPTTQIVFSIPQTERVTIDIYNILGEKVATLVNGTLNAGTHIVTFDARNSSGSLLPTGVYFYRLSTPDFTATRKMLLLK